MTPLLVKERLVNRIILKNIIINKLGLIPPKQIDTNVNAFAKVMDNIKKDIDEIASNSKTSAEFKEAIDSYVKVNPMTTSGNMSSLLEAVGKVSGVFEDRMDKFGLGSIKKLSSEVIRDETWANYSKLGENVQSEIKTILEQGLNQSKPVKEIQDEILNKIDGMTNASAERIARTETMNAYNRAEDERAKELGWTDFIVISSADCCQDCYELYNGNTFKSPDDDEIKPPLHYNCNCEERYVPSEDKAVELADVVSHDRPDLEK